MGEADAAVEGALERWLDVCGNGRRGGRGTHVGSEVGAEEDPGFIEAVVFVGFGVASPPGPVVVRGGGGGGGARAAGEVRGLERDWGGGEVEAAAGGE